MYLAQLLATPAGSYVIAIPATIACALLLVGIGLAVSRRQSPELVRRHSGADTYWSIQPEQIVRPEGVLTREHQPLHAASVDDEDTVDLTADLESYVSVGRRAVDSPVRHQEVAPNWVPPVGDLRIAILETATAEYLFVKQPKDQLRPRLVRSYVHTGAVQL